MHLANRKGKYSYTYTERRRGRGRARRSGRKQWIHSVPRKPDTSRGYTARQTEGDRESSEKKLVNRKTK